MIDWDALEAAIERRDFPAALEVALAAWRESRVPALADLVDAIGARIPVRALPPKTIHRAWLDLAAKNDSADVGTLIATIDRGVPRPTKKSSRFRAVLPEGWIERARALAERPDDPRIPRAIVTVLRESTWSIWEDDREATFVTPLRVVERSRDVRLLPLLDEAAAAAREGRLPGTNAAIRDALTPVIAALRAIEPPADEERAHAIIASLGGAPAVDLQPLLDLVLRDPDDDAARLVYADALTAAGDPRGEFITLQLLPDPTPEQTARMQSILRAHQGEWLGDLAHVFAGIRFERGMLASAELVNNAGAAAQVWARAPMNPLLATMHMLRKGLGNETHYSSFVFSPQMRSLRSVAVLSQKMLTPLTEGSWPFEAIDFAKTPNAATLDKVAAARSLPRLRRLELPANPADLAAIAELVAPRARTMNLDEVRLRRWSLPSGAENYATWWKAAPAFAPTAVGLELLYGHLWVRSTTNGLEAELTIHRPFRQDLELAEMPPLARLVVRTPRALRDDPDLRAILASLARFEPIEAPL